MLNADTIVAIATAAGRGGIGVVRISGPKSESIAQAVLGKLPVPRVALLSNFLDENLITLDHGIALYFPRPNSFTGENVLELQGHGGPAVLQLILQRCMQLGARLAEPGEFTKRAFLNDKIDLAQAESVVDLIDASSTEAARSAMRSLQGDFSRLVADLVAKLINLRMLVEATLDFPEEELDFLEAAGAHQKLIEVMNVLERVMQTAKQGSLLREGIHVVLIGQPNVGKSSLLNTLAGEDIAIVTPVPGTTRDSIQQSIKIQGIPLHVIDTAGLRITEDEVEKIGIDRTWQAVSKSNVAVLVIDVETGITQADLEILCKLPPELTILRVFNKIDVTSIQSHVATDSTFTDIYLSAKSGDGVQLLRKELLRVVGWQPSGEGVFMARERHLLALAESFDALSNACTNWQHLELLAEDLRLAQYSLNKITGEYSSDDLLGEIFSNFCIGK